MVHRLLAPQTTMSTYPSQADSVVAIDAPQAFNEPRKSITLHPTKCPGGEETPHVSMCIFLFRSLQATR
jgi:hypothetical protein